MCLFYVIADYSLYINWRKSTTGANPPTRDIPILHTTHLVITFQQIKVYLLYYNPSITYKARVGGLMLVGIMQNNPQQDLLHNYFTCIFYPFYNSCIKVYS